MFKEAETQKAKETLDCQMYRTDMRLVQNAFDEGHIGVVSEVLGKYLPMQERNKLRGWEWFYWWQQSHACGTVIDMSSVPLGGDICYSLAKAPDGFTFAVDQHTGIAICDIRERKAVQFSSVDSSRRFQSMVYLRKGGILAATGIDDSVHLWDTKSWKQLPPLPGGGLCLAMCENGPNGETLAVAKSDKQIVLWDTQSWNVVKSLSTECRYPFTCLAFSPDGKTLVAGASQYNGFFKTPSLEGGLHILDVATGEAKECKQPISTGVLSTAFSPDGKLLAVGSVDHTIQVMDAHTLTSVRILPVSAPVLSVTFSPDSCLLAASTSRDNAIRVWDTNSFTLTATIKGHNWLVRAITFMDDSETLVSTSWDGTIRTWDVKRILSANVIRGQFHRLVFSPDGGSIIAFRTDGRICAFDVVTGQIDHDWNDDDTYLNAAFSCDGRVIAAINKSGQLRIFRLGHEKTINEFPIENLPLIGNKDSFHGSGMAVDRSGEYVAWNEDTTAGYSIAIYDANQRTQRAVADVTRTPHHYLEFSPDREVSRFTLY